jgi:hypothetical protein
LKSAVALRAFMRDEKSVEADVGALLVADGLHCLRVVRQFLIGSKE